MKVAVDCHLHIYPQFGPEPLLRSALATLRGVSPGSAYAGLLVEREAQSVFENLRSERSAGTVAVEPVDDLTLRAMADGAELFLVAGRQIATAERIEVLAYGVNSVIPDGVPAREAVRRTIDGGGCAALAWSPGKWMFARARIIDGLLSEFAPDELLLCDSTLRPALWGTPSHFRRAALESRRVLYGSDPLPMNGGYEVAGTYATVWEQGFDPGRPGSSLLRLLSLPGRSAGSRPSLTPWLRRFVPALLRIGA